MKKTIILASVAIATLFAFSSCQKEELEKTSVSGVRVITAEFENNGTKTTLNADGKTPEWAEGDVIRILNGTTYQDITLAAGDITNNKIKFTTTLTGTLYAVYPASATAMTSCSGSITYTIPAIQDGTFGSANICVAKSSTTDGTNKDKLVFSNATAVLKIKTAADVVGVDITATNNIAGPVTALFSGNEITLTPNLTGKTVSAVGTTVPSGNVFYLAAAPGSTGSTTATCYKIDKEGSTNRGDKELKRNVIYSMDLSSITIATDSDLTGKKGILNGHEYVIIKAKYDDTNYSYLKWATMNVGATTVAGSGETCYGDYYAWGETEPYYATRTWDNTDKKWYFNEWNTNKSSGYAWQSYCGNSSFTEWSTPPYDAITKILNSEKDAATQNWGTGWRMPTAAEFKALYEACGKTGTSTIPTTGGSTTAPDIYWCTDYNGVAGLLFITKDDGPHLFFPAAGVGNGTDHSVAGSSGYYWSSFLFTGNTDDAFNLSFVSDKVSSQGFIYRYLGLSVRPVSD